MLDLWSTQSLVYVQPELLQVLSHPYVNVCSLASLITSEHLEQIIIDVHKLFSGLFKSSGLTKCVGTLTTLQPGLLQSASQVLVYSCVKASTTFSKQTRHVRAVEQSKSSFGKVWATKASSLVTLQLGLIHLVEQSNG